MLSAIIQARMTSSRLPGKIMKSVLGNPLLHYLVERLFHVPEIGQIIIATTKNHADDLVEDFCKTQGVLCHRGSEEDVLGRIFEAASRFGADPVMRLTADCPLLDTEVLSRQAKYFQEYRPDYCYLGLTFAEGICSDLFTIASLKYAHEHAIEQAEREHVTPYLHKNNHRFKIAGLENDTDDSRYRFVVDNPEDLDVVSAIIENLYEPGREPFDMHAVKDYLDQNPEIFRVNANVIRNESYDSFRIFYD